MVIDPGIDELETYESIRTVNFEQKAMPYQELSIHEPPVSHIGQVMKTNKLRLRVLLSFSDAQYERAFIAHYVEFYRRYAQVSLLLGVVLVFGDFLVDYFAHPGVRANFFRVWICVPILFAGLGYSFLQQAKRNWQSTMSAFIVAVALILFWILLLIDQEGGPGLKTWVGVLNFTFLTLYCFVILGVQFRFALFAGIVILVAFESAMWFGYAMEKVQVAYWTYHVVTVFILAAAIGWWREYLLRLEYLARISLDEARQSAEHMTKMKSDYLANTETALRENEAQFDFALRSTQMGVWSLDIINNKRYFDEHACHLLGIDPSTFNGTPEEFFDAVHRNDRAKIREAHSRTIGHNAMYEVEYRVVWSDMSIHYISARGKLVHDDAGHPVRINGVAWDITERSQAAEHQRELEERLQRAEKMEALGTLAGGVAHDLNNVLGVVVGYSEMLLDGVDKSSPLKNGLENVMNGGLKAAAIVDDLLTLARRGVQGRGIVNLNKIVAECQKSPELANLSSHHPAVKIITDLETDLLNISGSSVHLGKSLYNLISNASEAMPKGGTVAIKTTNQYLDRPIQGYDQVRGGDYVVLSVSDTGEGIPDADLKRIFEPFYTKKVMGRSGTGLGLAVVWGTVKDHNGYINVQSEEGKGSTFTLYFPVTREDITAEYIAAPISEYLGKGESILVVDDVKEQRDLAASILSTLNYRVASVSSGEEAVAYLKEHQADLMVLDMIMDPGMDGLDTYKSILEIRPNQKAIIVSGFSESDRVKTAESLGAGAYVRKPYIKEKLGLAVRKALDRK
jgi:PAS domain S-box-containing protein